MQRLYKGEKRFVGIEVYRDDGASFSISDASYAVVNDKYEAVADFGDAFVSGTSVYALLDTGLECYEAGKSYYAYFNCMIVGLGKSLIGRCQVHIEPSAEFESGT